MESALNGLLPARSRIDLNSKDLNSLQGILNKLLIVEDQEQLNCLCSDTCGLRPPIFLLAALTAKTLPI
jgi:hypothetical protein